MSNRAQTVSVSARALLAVAALVLASCTPASPSGGTGTTSGPATAGQPTSGGTLTIGTSQDVLTLDIPNYRSTQDLLIGGLIFDSLLTYDKDAKLQPGLAESWKQVDTTTYEFKLRKGVKFHDGTPADAEAVKKHFEWAKTQLKGQRFYSMITSITTEGSETVTFKLDKPYTPFISNIAFATGAVMSPAAVAKFDKEKELPRNPVGTGPYKLSEWVATQRMVLERNPDYWGPAPKLNKIVIRYIQDESTRMAALEAGEVDVIQNAPPHRAAELKSSQKLQLLTGPYAQVFWLGFTHTNPLLADVRVRQAIASVVDRETLVKNVAEGMPRLASGFVPPELAPPVAAPARVDMAKAKELLAQAGHPNGFRIDLWTTNGVYLRDKEIAEALQAPLKSIGVDAQVKVMEYAAFADGMARHEAGLFTLGWAHTPAPDSLLRGVFLGSSAANWSGYKNAKVDELIEKAVVQSSYEDAVKVWQEVEQTLAQDVAGVPIYWSTLLYAASTKVHDFAPTPFGQFDIKNAWVG
jgi:peptide/nickel transport system substrate-binding protein